jgi:glyoxylase-like metal-dependent hydrolase (beta-lactamase superfamily II)
MPGVDLVVGRGINMLADGLHWLDDWFAIAEVAPGITAIGEPRFHQFNWNYLIVGTHQALLFDTGPGVRDISKAVAKLTNLPVTAMPSHMHFDHTGGLHFFEDIAVADLPLLRAGEQAGLFSPPAHLFLGEEEGMTWTPLAVRRWWPVGHVIDLGHRSLEILQTPGHAPDHVALLDHSAGILFAGDVIYPGPLYAQVPGADLKDYLDTARRLHGLLPDGARIFCSHGGPDGEGLHRVPELGRSDLADLVNALVRLHQAGGTPTTWPVNDRVSLVCAPAAFAAWQVSR